MRAKQKDEWKEISPSPFGRGNAKRRVLISRRTLPPIPPRRSPPTRIVLHLDHWSGQSGTLDLPVTTEVRRGAAASMLADEAGEPGVGLVVVATHGRSGLQAIWAGSVSVGLLARTHAPVLLMRRIEA